MVELLQTVFWGMKILSLQYEAEQVEHLSSSVFLLSR